MKSLNWLLYQVHRWVGLVLGLFMFFWFFTGLVIMYSTPTTQSRSQLLAHAETLSPQLDWLSLGEAWDRSTEQRKAAIEHKSKAAETSDAKQKQGNVEITIAEARLVRSAGEPVWLVEDSQGQRFALSALDGKLRITTPDQAETIARNWFVAENKESVNASYVDTVDKPIILRNQDALSPFHRIAVGDGGELLVSSRTGEVLHASTRVDRAFYWAGNWLHLLKPMEFLGLGKYRSDTQLWLGLFATLATLTGLIIGWLRWRPGYGGKRTYSEGRTQPYREFWFKWHFWSGLIGGTVVLFWALSGFLDTNPGKLFSTGNPSRQEMNRYLGSELPVAIRQWQPVLPVLLAAAVDGSDVVELGLRQLGGNAVLLAITRDGKRLPQVLEGAQPQFSDTSLIAAVLRLATKSQVQTQTLLMEYDSYYYPRHSQSLVEKPLPVLLVQLADEAETRFYLDPQDGRLLTRIDKSGRLLRWLYSGLHHSDFGWLYQRPIWDIWMLIWVTFGLVLGTSSLVIGWRLLKKTFAPRKRVIRRTPNRVVKLEPDSTEITIDI